MKKKDAKIKPAKPRVKEFSQDETIKQILRINESRFTFRCDFPKLFRTFDCVQTYPDNTIDTACVIPIFEKDSGEFTGMHDLAWSPSYIKNLTDRQLIGVQMHELLHVLLEHTTKRRPALKSVKVDSHGRQTISDLEDQVYQRIWNIAADLSINQLISSYLIDGSNSQADYRMVGVHVGEKDFKDMLPGKNAEFYFQKLCEKYKSQIEDAQKMQELLKELERIFKEGKLDDHGNWLPEDESKEQARKLCQGKKSDDGIEKDKEEVKKMLKEIADVVLGPGTSPNANNEFNPKAGKERTTPGWMKQTTHSSVHGFDAIKQLSRKIPNRRYGLLFPGKKSYFARNQVLIAVDVSGSIDDGLLQIFTEHLNKMLKHADFDLCLFNTNILSKDGKCVWNDYDSSNPKNVTFKWKRSLKFYSGGGTNFEPVMKLWNLINKKYDALFVFTDGDAMYSTAPKRPKEVNWILYGTDCYINHGRKYQMER